MRDGGDLALLHIAIARLTAHICGGLFGHVGVGLLGIGLPPRLSISSRVDLGIQCCRLRRRPRRLPRRLSLRLRLALRSLSLLGDGRGFLLGFLLRLFLGLLLGRLVRCRHQLGLFRTAIAAASRRRHRLG